MPPEKQFDIEYRTLAPDGIVPALFNGFERRQEVTHCWRKDAASGQWTLKDIAFTEDWDEANFEELCGQLRGTLAAGGSVIGAFGLGGALAGFGSVENAPLGGKGQYLQLSQLHVTRGLRGRGIGAELFRRLAARAAALGAQKLYISAHSSRETRAFYARMGCVEAQEYDPRLTALEPCDCQLEYVLPQRISCPQGAAGV